MRWYLNLRAGLVEAGVAYDTNNFAALRRNPGSIACVIGKSHVVRKIPSHSLIIFGPGLGSHPSEADFWSMQNLRLLVHPCKWMQDMFDRSLHHPVPSVVWPAGIETAVWSPPPIKPDTKKVLVYDKIRWDRLDLEQVLLNPILKMLKDGGYEIQYLKYGSYCEDEYRKVLASVGSMIFLCEHETQGFAYLQALSCGVPIFAWDRGGHWRDPSFFPNLAIFEPVTSVPYFSPTCGMRFQDFDDFGRRFKHFMERVENTSFSPREFVCRELNLKKQALEYCQIVRSVSGEEA
jgi:hypothetical protein